MQDAYGLPRTVLKPRVGFWMEPMSAKSPVRDELSRNNSFMCRREPSFVAPVSHRIIRHCLSLFNIPVEIRPSTSPPPGGLTHQKVTCHHALPWLRSRGKVAGQSEAKQAQRSLNGGLESFRKLLMHGFLYLQPTVACLPNASFDSRLDAGSFRR